MMRPMFRRVRRLLRSATAAPEFRPAYARAASTLARCTPELSHDARGGDGVLPHFDATLRAPLLGDVAALVARRPSDAQLDRWIEAACEDTRAAVREGLPVYERRSGCLGPGFPWGHAGDDPQDVLYAARPHRFAFAPRYALAVAAQGASAQALHALLHDWMTFAASHPALPYISNLVAIQRLLACTWAFGFLSAAGGSASVDACRHALLCIVAEDIRFLGPRLGSSHPNNHLLLDRFAAWFIASFYPELMARAHRPSAESAWLEELERQTYDDGGSFEHSIHYHAFATEMASLYLLAVRRSGSQPAAVLTRRIARMLRLQALLAGPAGRPPPLGDGTDDSLFPLDAGGCSAAGAFREIYRSAFDPSFPPAHASDPAVERAFWLLRGQLAPRTAHAAPAALVEFPDSGLFLFTEHDEATRCVFRTGPVHADRTTAGHMHSDLLSVTLTMRGTPVLVDAGTSTYRFARAAGPDHVNWRAHFMGPAAHNGFVVEGVDPVSELTGDFRDARTLARASHVGHADAGALAFAEARLEGAPGVPELRRGVVHLRGLGALLYGVVPEEATDQRIVAPFLLDPACTVDRVERGRARVIADGRAMTFAWPAQLGAAAYARGQARPPAGWVAPAYGRRVPAPQLTLPANAPLSALALLDDDLPSVVLECVRPSAAARAFRLQAGAACDHVVVNLDAGSGPVLAWGLRFHGPLLWLQLRADAAPLLHAPAGAWCDMPGHGAVHPGGEPVRLQPVQLSPTRERERLPEE